MTIADYRLPPGIERGSKFMPTFKNVIQEAIAGNEQRFAQWTKCRGVGDLSYGLLESSDPAGDYAAILAVYLAHNGSLVPFPFKNWSDFQAVDQNFGTGDGVETVFQLKKNYDPRLIILNSAGSLVYVREINLPVLSTVAIEVDGTPKTIVTDYTITSRGVVTFTTPPASMKACTWSGEFDLLVRFDGDLPIVMNEADLISIGSIPIREVIGE